jgi:hypothetical protein
MVILDFCERRFAQMSKTESPCTGGLNRTGRNVECRIPEEKGNYLFLEDHNSICGVHE